MSMSSDLVATDERRQELQRLLDELSPYLEAEGGELSLVSLEDRHAVVAYKCRPTSCASQQALTRIALRKTIRQRSDGLDSVEVV